eukprot:TRINITY_DN687_c0_g1_i15.p1 TRINITY_DN687_c0_g1~~TRINITY_DN687_c0_g1_i15.p1  ORF type:complete len:265 (+),score=86.30 TRINITY_DN687_c0_g1_i15:223-1017(+)
MKDLTFLTLVSLCLLQPMVQAFFFGPIAVGLGVGLLAAGGGFLLGTSLSRSRSRRSYRQSRNYRYQPSHHWDSSYNRYYAQPRQNYYYGSDKWSSHHRGKRSADQLEELHRMKRDIDENGFNMNDWYRDMTEMDQDSCGKKLICELRSKEASGVSMSVEEKLIAEKFGSGKQVDVSDITVEFDLAAQIGRNMGEARCQQLYNRCETSTADMVKMIRTEFENLKDLQKDLDNSVDADAQMKKEKDDLMKEFKEDKIDLDKNWNWA